MEPALPESLTLPSGVARVEWRRNSRARRVSLRIDPAGGAVIVTLPKRATQKAGLDLLLGHVDWVAKRLDALPRAVQFRDGASVPIAGVPHLIRNVVQDRIRDVPNARGAAWIADDVLHVTGAPEFLPRRVRDFLRQEAQRRLTPITLEKAAQVGIRPNRVTMKDTTSRWGSCAPDRSIALSWRLVMAPPFVQEYVAAHEVAHLRHMNHGRQFWALLDELTPHTDAAVAWLKAEGAGLLRIG